LIGTGDTVRLRYAATEEDGRKARESLKSARRM
jgi:hypothetical protein